MRLIGSSFAASALLLTESTLPTSAFVSPSANTLQWQTTSTPQRLSIREMTSSVEGSSSTSDENKKCAQTSTLNSTTTNASKKLKSKRLYSFTEARRIARGHGFDSHQEFVEYTCAGAYQVPKDADVIWSDEFKGWDDFLGIILSFEEGRKVAQSLEGITTEESYLDLIKSKTIPDDSIASRLPYRPDLKYKDVWINWDDFLIGGAE